MQFSVRQKDKFHLTGKPTLLMEHLVQIVPAPALILDPLMGSGTTAIACGKHGHRFIGIEREAYYFQVAQQRLVEVGRGKAVCH